MSGLTLQCTSPSPVKEAGCVLDCRAWTQLIATYLAASIISSDTIQEVDLHIFALLSPSSGGVSGVKCELHSGSVVSLKLLGRSV